MASLVRTVSGTYEQSDCLTLKQVSEVQEAGQIDTYLRPLEDALRDFSFVEVEEEYVKIINGQVLARHPELTETTPVVFTKNGKALAVYKMHPTKQELMKPEKMFPVNY